MLSEQVQIPAGLQSTPQSNPMPAPTALTTREVEVLRLMADGLSSRQIAAHLGIRFKTVAAHRNHILQKLQMNNTVSAVRWAIRTGLVLP